MRSPAELGFRLRQEALNLRYRLLPPRLPDAALAPAPLPLPRPETFAARLDPTYRAELLTNAARIAAGELPAFGAWIDPGGPIRWRKDYRHGHETPAVYFRRIPYLDFTRAGDHKWIWEINRHQHLVTLAQAWALDPQPIYLRTLTVQLESWLEQNPPQLGINWASALEVAFRALSWIWIWHLAGAALPPVLAKRFLETLYAHGLHLEANLSIYFSPNTHLLGEALALDALGRLFPAMPGAADWVRIGSREMALALERQVRPDGGYFEQSSAYHVYALDMFLLHRVLAGPGTPAEMESLGRMAAFLEALQGAPGRIPLLGDDDGGRLFSPFGRRDEFGRATLAVWHALTDSPLCAWPESASEMALWWLGRAPAAATAPAFPATGLAASPATGLVASPATGLAAFPDTGLAVLRANGIELFFDAGPFGPGSAGHSHADTLQLLVRRDGRDTVIDPGTETYIADAASRDRFRSSAWHATVAVGDAEQATPDGPFRWRGRPEARLLAWRQSETASWALGECLYAGIRHRRAVLLEKAAPRVWVADWLEWTGPARPLAQIWPLAADPEPSGDSTFFCENARFVLEPGGTLSIEERWRCSHFGNCRPAKAAVAAWLGSPSAGRAAMIDWNRDAPPARLHALWEGRQVRLRLTEDGLDVAEVVVPLGEDEQGSK